MELQKMIWIRDKMGPNVGPITEKDAFGPFLLDGAPLLRPKNLKATFTSFLDCCYVLGHVY